MNKTPPQGMCPNRFPLRGTTESNYSTVNTKLLFENKLNTIRVYWFLCNFIIKCTTLIIKTKI